MSAYWVVRVNVVNEAKLAAYAPLAKAVVDMYGGVYLARGGAYDTKEGAPYTRNVIVSWPDMDTAQQAYESPEYAQALAVLGDGADRIFVILEGLPD